MRNILFILAILISWGSLAQHPLKIAVISDTHYLSKKLATDGSALQNFEAGTGRNVEDLHQVLSQVLSELEAQQPDILLIAGDITNHGERDSHIDITAKLKPLAENGTRIFVVPGNHDVNVPNPKAYIADKPTPTTSISAQEFEEIYAPFGYNDAIKRDTASLSYVAEVNDSIWLLSIDSNKYKEHTTSTISSGRILPETMSWILDILEEANSKDILVMGLMHHGLVEHMPYQSTFMSDYLIDNWKNNAEILANNGLKVIFTGHFHSNDITLLTTSQGNEIYDIETGSLAGYPFPYRLMTLQDNKLNIESYFIDSIPGKQNLQEEYRFKAEKIGRRIAQSKINSMSLPIPTDLKDLLIDMLVKMQILHMKGDEKVDAEMQQMIEQLSDVLGDPNASIDSFKLDFPPADNFVEIEL
ncbi:MAG: metallophosphoesterase [Bacteroidales bacterium]|nr:metallophosphoesterase [Bacteroidales bacterium]